ncbi:geranylgeranyl transferase type-1 subunit beta [Spiromyces aspiralis]|uniref:Geranylgeranyl transferase type-1 subunit beta n=1 Tax=Spiromyces aspiralis TaxID=68401 RepID=A0ACC1HB36_9FUNG|nr:geranylgeranyl transferase type-1 subunit beta [Spiromyces aspiralis]
MRFLYSACIVSYLLNDWRGVDIERATEYILMCTRYDGGITQEPMQESHGGSYFCALASLALMNKLDALEDRRMTLEWGLRRQVGGFQGRVNKPADVCYSFWVGSGIEILGGHQFVDLEEAARFVLECQHAIGGLGKFKGSLPGMKTR